MWGAALSGNPSSHFELLSRSDPRRAVRIREPVTSVRVGPLVSLVWLVQLRAAVPVQLVLLVSLVLLAPLVELAPPEQLVLLPEPALLAPLVELAPLARPGPASEAPGTCRSRATR